MNPDEQRARRTAVTELRADTETVITGLAKEIAVQRVKDWERTEHAIARERTERMQAAADQGAYIDRRDAELGVQIDDVARELGAFRYQTVWRRLAWLLFGTGA